MIIRSELTGAAAFPARYRNTCWSSLAPEDTVKLGANYLPTEAKLESADAFVSKVGESDEVRRQTSREADAWYAAITADMFG